MKSLFSLLLFAFVIIACGTRVPSHSVFPDEYSSNPPPVGMVELVTPVWVDKNFTTNHRIAIHQAIVEWNHALNGYQRFDVVSDDFDMELDVLYQIERTGQGLVVLARKSSDPIMSELPDGVLAWVPMNPDGGNHQMDVVSDVIGNRDLHAIVMHELGHVLGLPHVLIKNTLMYPSYTYGASCVDRVTVQALASLRGSRFDWRHMNYCERPL